MNGADVVIKTPLMPHQEAAIAKLRALKVGALFMEMGLGKSLTMMRLVALKRGVRRVMWFCPVSLKETIRQEILKHCEGAEGEICVFGEDTSEDALPGAFWNIIGIESMSSSNRLKMAAAGLVSRATCVIVDESTYIKGRSERTKWITAIGESAGYRYILTGTPFTQGVVDLYSQFRFLDARILGYRSFFSFAANHLEYSKRHIGMIVRSHNAPYLAAKIAPYAYQISKRDAAVELPEKLYATRYFSMTAEQAERYKQAKDEILAEVFGEFTAHTIFRLFSALQQIINGWWNRRDPETNELRMVEFAHHRLEMLRDVLNEIPAGEKVVIWARYRRDVEAVAALLPGKCARFYGDLSESERNEELRGFRAGKQYLVATAACGGHGLTLNEAAWNVFFNNEFKYSNRIQAEDRTHRIGQVRPVTYVDLVCAGSIDTRIQRALATKGNVLEDFRREIALLREKKTLKETMEEVASRL
jgi:SNF2 family DNA or RNA helicase